MQPRAVRAEALLFLMVVIWALNFSVTKDALATVPPLAFNALRYPLAALVVLLALRARGPIPLPERGDRARVVMLGLLGNVIYQVCFIVGIHHTRAGTASVLLAGTPVLTALLSAWKGHEQVVRAMWVGLGAALAGILLVVPLGGAASGEETLLGDLLMLGASAAWALYTVGSRDLVQRYGSLPMTAWTLTAGAITLVLIGLPSLRAVDPGALPLEIWLAIAYAGSLSIGAAYLIWYAAVRAIGNTRTSAFSNLVPALALLIAWLWLGEVPTLRQVVGAAVIIAGVSMTQLAARRRPALP